MTETRFVRYNENDIVISHIIRRTEQEPKTTRTVFDRHLPSLGEAAVTAPAIQLAVPPDTYYCYGNTFVST
jgi:hypothetical protein